MKYEQGENQHTKRKASHSLGSFLLTCLHEWSVDMELGSDSAESKLASSESVDSRHGRGLFDAECLHT